MSGCYGNDPEDRYWSNRLDDYLDSICPDDGCPDCLEIQDECECEEEE